MVFNLNLATPLIAGMEGPWELGRQQPGSDALATFKATRHISGLMTG